MTLCHGCKKETKKKHIHEVSFDNVIVKICEDCKKDVPQRMGKPIIMERKRPGLKKIHSLTARFVKRKPTPPLSTSPTSSETTDTPTVITSAQVDPMPSTSGTSGSGSVTICTIGENAK